MRSGHMKMSGLITPIHTHTHSLRMWSICCDMGSDISAGGVEDKLLVSLDSFGCARCITPAPPLWTLLNKCQSALVFWGFQTWKKREGVKSGIKENGWEGLLWVSYFHPLISDLGLNHPFLQSVISSHLDWIRRLLQIVCKTSQSIYLYETNKWAHKLHLIFRHHCLLLTEGF